MKLIEQGSKEIGLLLKSFAGAQRSAEIPRPRRGHRLRPLGIWSSSTTRERDVVATGCSMKGQVGNAFADHGILDIAEPGFHDLAVLDERIAQIRSPGSKSVTDENRQRDEQTRCGRKNPASFRLHGCPNAPPTDASLPA